MLEDDVNKERLAKITMDFTGSDIKCLVNLASIRAIKD